MLSEKILEELICFTEEEINYLNGNKEVDKSIYLNDYSSIVDYQKLFWYKEQEISVSKHARFCVYPPHKHNFLELMYVYSGEMTHIIENKKITLYEGELLLLNQNVEHSVLFCNENDIIFNFIIKLEYLEFLPHISQEKSILFDFIYSCLYSNENIGEYIIFRIRHDPFVKECIDNIITNIYTPHIHNELELKLLVGLLLTELMKQPKNIEIYKTQSYEKKIVNSILEYILNNYQEGSLTKLSEMIHQPTYKICRLVKENTGQTFKQLIQEERMKQTVHLLKNTELSISQVMVEVGYENITYFYKLFKQKYKMTPYQLREKEQQQHYAN